MPAMTVKDMSDKYFISNDYNTLSDKSKVDYKYFMNVLLSQDHRHVWHTSSG